MGVPASARVDKIWKVRTSASKCSGAPLPDRLARGVCGPRYPSSTFEVVPHSGYRVRGCCPGTDLSPTHEPHVLNTCQSGGIQPRGSRGRIQGLFLAGWSGGSRVESREPAVAWVSTLDSGAPTFLPVGTRGYFTRRLLNLVGASCLWYDDEMGLTF